MKTFPCVVGFCFPLNSTDVNCEMVENAFGPIVLTVSGIVIDATEIPLNAFSQIVVTWLNVNFVTELHPLNALFPIVVILLGIFISFNVLHPLNASSGIDVNPFPNVTDGIATQFLNDPTPIDVTIS